MKPGDISKLINERRDNDDSKFSDLRAWKNGKCMGRNGVEEGRLTVGTKLDVPQELGTYTEVLRSSCQCVLGAQECGQTRDSSSES